MNKYPFARFYLAGLLAVAVAVLACGLLLASIYGAMALKAAASIATTKASVTYVDTHSLPAELQAAADTIVPFVRRQHPDFEVRLPDAHFPVSRHAALRQEELAAFAYYTAQAATAVDQLKGALLGAFNDAVETMIVSATRALPRSAARSAPPAASEMPGVVGESGTLHLEGALTPARLETVARVATLLRQRTPFYTPSREAQTLADSAGQNLEAVVGLLRAELTRDGVGRDLNTPEEPEEDLQIRLGQSDKAALISEFIAQLQMWRRTVHGVILDNWRLDETLATATETAHARAEAGQARIRAARSVALAHGIKAGTFLLGSIAIFMLLLAARDFMSAVIDTAGHTGGMLKHLSNAEIEHD